MDVFANDMAKDGGQALAITLENLTNAMRNEFKQPW